MKFNILWYFKNFVIWVILLFPEKYMFYPTLWLFGVLLNNSNVFFIVLIIISYCLGLCPDRTDKVRTRTSSRREWICSTNPKSGAAQANPFNHHGVKRSENHVFKKLNQSHFILNTVYIKKYFCLQNEQWALFV